MRLLIHFPDDASPEERELFARCAMKAFNAAIRADAEGWNAAIYRVKVDEEEEEREVYANYQRLITGYRVNVGWIEDYA